MRKFLIFVLLLGLGTSCASSFSRKNTGFNREATKFQGVLENKDQQGKQRPEPVTREGFQQYNRELRDAGFSFLDVCRDLDEQFATCEAEVNRLREVNAVLATKAAKWDALVYVFFGILILAAILLVLRWRYGNLLGLASKSVSALSGLPGLITSWWSRK